MNDAAPGTLPEHRQGADRRGQGQALRPERDRPADCPQGARRAASLRPSGPLLLFEWDVEQLFPVLDELGVGFVAYSPLGRGFITEHRQTRRRPRRHRHAQRRPPLLSGNFEKNVEAVGKLGDLATTKGITGAVDVPLTGDDLKGQ
ncbi:aldo/keto reductase [Streptomyces mirabilis]|uniref:aldo/keto reductase n=1 Tax=Streptomyces mirabilis TaxID=68239 RepID=UPI00339E2357